MNSAFFIVTTLIIGTTAAAPHKFEDGFVERAVGVVVRNDVAEIRYAVGLNDNTMDQLVKEWKQKSLKNPKKTPAQPNTPLTLTLPQAADTSTKASANGPIPTPEQRVARFTEAWKRVVSSDLQIESDGKLIRIEKIEIEPAPRHPYRAILKIKFKLPAAEDANLKIVDRNFARQTGAVRYALKATGDSLLLNSNVAPIVVRAERVELKTLNADKRRTATTIQARISIVETPKR